MAQGRWVHPLGSRRNSDRQLRADIWELSGGTIRPKLQRLAATKAVGHSFDLAQLDPSRQLCRQVSRMGLLLLQCPSSLQFLLSLNPAFSLAVCSRRGKRARRDNTRATFSDDCTRTELVCKHTGPSAV